MSDNQPEVSINDQMAQRRAKLQNLIDDGINAYGHRYDDITSSSIIKESFKDDCEEPQKAKAAGRLMTMRDMGKSIFATIQDEEGTLQLFAQKNKMGEENFKRFKKLDIGDIIGADGILFRTGKGEVTLREFEYTILAKALRPLPDKWAGLKDVESRYRNRFMDLISNRESMKVLRQRAEIVREVRHYLEDEGYLEVETPMMHPIVGGATARPFETHYNALDQTMYMRIAPELYLKQLLVGGFQKVFELNRNFRNEGTSRQHNPEFTALEVYQAYGNCETMMDLIEGMIKRVAVKIGGSLQIVHSEEKTLDFSSFRRVTYEDLVCEYTREDWFQLSREERITEARNHGCHIEDGAEDFVVTQEVYEKLIEPKLIQPTFVMRLPVEAVPLAKRCVDRPDLVDVYELVIDGKEISPGYTELNDPIDQRQRLEDQLKRTMGTEDELSGKIDEHFLTSLEQGMPPAGGLGLGIDRLAMLITGASTIRDVILFPQLKNR